MFYLFKLLLTFSGFRWLPGNSENLKDSFIPFNIKSSDKRHSITISKNKILRFKIYFPEKKESSLVFNPGGKEIKECRAEKSATCKCVPKNPCRNKADYSPYIDPSASPWRRLHQPYGRNLDITVKAKRGYHPQTSG